MDIMKRITALVLTTALVGSGCAQRLATPVAFSIAHAQARAIRDAADPRDLEDRRKYIEQLPAGTAVLIDLADGTQLKATLIGVELDVVIVQPRTRLPEAYRRIPLQAIVSLSPESRNLNVGNAMAIGVGAGVASFVALFLIVMTFLDN
jgi:hypothetical protein